MKLYLAGPMRGLPEFNFPAFFAAEESLVRAGFEVVNPARRDVDNGFQYEGLTGNEDLSEQGFNLSEALLWDLGEVAAADGVALLYGYSSSKGAKAEISLAQALGKPVKLVGQWVGNPIHGEPHARVTVDDVDEPLLHGGAVLTTSETGGQKGQKPAQASSLDAVALLKLAEVSGFGAKKYAAHNYLKGYPWSLSLDALHRHVWAFMSGQDNDEETGLPHMAHAAWHALALVSFQERELGTDDRFHG